MTTTMLYTLWGSLYALCAALSFLPERPGFLGIFCFAAGIVFFLPPHVILHRSNTRQIPRLFTGISLFSLVLTTCLILANFLSVSLSESAGNALHVLLCFVSVPMFCLNNWALSLFLWAVLLVCSLKRLKKK